MLRRTPMSLVAFLVAGCSAEGAIEGLDPATCTDGIDNDLDSYVDCADNGCWSTPACTTDDTDTVDTNDTDPVDTNDTNPRDTDDTNIDTTTDLAAYKAMSVRYRLDVTPIGGSIGLLTNFGFPDAASPCSASYAGSGVLVEAEGDRIMFEGEWNEVEDGCPAFPPNDTFPQFAGLTLASTSVWYVATGEAFHTFRFPASRTRISSWVAHRFEEDNGLTTDPFANGQYWIKFTEPHTFDQVNIKMTYTETQLLSLQGILPMRFVSTYEVLFSETDTPPEQEPYALP